MHPSDNTYDILIIGSGLGGLVCAVILAKEGHKVCVLEKNRQIGGSLQTYVRDKTIFDSGVHYIGGLDPGQTLYKIFRYLGILDKMKIKRLDNDCFDKIIFENDSHEYVLAQGYDNFIAKLVAQFPDDEQAIRAYCDKVIEACSKVPLYNLSEREPEMSQMGSLEMDAKGFIDSLTNNQRLRDVLSGNNVLYAGEPNKTPFYVHALVVNSYIESSWKCVDGGSQIARLLAKEIRSHGGEIFRNCEVTKLVETDGRISHAELADGTKVYARDFISNVHPVKTLEMTDSVLLKNAYRNRIKSIDNSVSSFTLNVVLKENCFPHFNNNYYYYDEGTVWTGAEYTEENWPRGYAIFLHTYSDTTKFTRGMSILTYMRYADVAGWSETHNTVSHQEFRGESYEAFKKRKAETLLDKVEVKFPGFRDCIKAYYCATPLSYRDYIGNDDGSLYGLSKDYKDYMRSFISPKTKVPNLFLTGQNINLHGVLGVSVSSLVTCSSFIEMKELIRRINAV